MFFMQRVKDRLLDTNLFWGLFCLGLPLLLWVLERLLQRISLSEDHLLDLLGASFVFLLCCFALLHSSPIPEDHSQAGKSVSPLPLSLAMAALLGCGGVLLIPGLLYQHGFDGLLPSLGILGGLFAFLLSVGSAMRRFGALTLPELLGLRFGPHVRCVALLLSTLSTLGLLVVAFSSTVDVASRFFHMPLLWGSALTAGAIAGLVVPGGLRSALKSTLVLYGLLGLCFLGCLSFVSFKLYGTPFPQGSMLVALQSVGPAEEALIDKGGVDFGLFKPFTKEFLTVDRLNWFLLSLSLVAALAVCPPLLHIHACGRSFSEARKSVTGAMLWSALLLTAMPFAALQTRLDTYGVVAKETAFSDLPDWILAASERDMIRIHGVSLSLLEHVISAIREGRDSNEAAAEPLRSYRAEEEEHWNRLDETVHTALMDVAKQYAHTAGPTRETLKKDFGTEVLPIAAKQSGNTSGHLTLAALAFDPVGFLLAFPQRAQLPFFFQALWGLTLLGAGLGVSALLTACLVSMLVHDGLSLRGRVHDPSVQPVTAGRFLSLVLLLFLSLAVCFFRVPVSLLLVGSLSLSAVGLLPALLMGGWGTRATSQGCLAGMVVGCGCALYYFLGTSTLSVSFYETWSSLSNAGPEAYANFLELKSSLSAEEGAAKDALAEELRVHTSGSYWSPGLANWFGIAPAAAPVLATPLALLTIFLVSCGREKLSRKKTDLRS